MGSPKELQSMEVSILAGLRNSSSNKNQERATGGFEADLAPITLCRGVCKADYIGDANKNSALRFLGALSPGRELEQFLLSEKSHKMRNIFYENILHSYGDVMEMETIYRNNMGLILDLASWNDIYNSMPHYRAQYMEQVCMSPRDLR